MSTYTHNPDLSFVKNGWNGNHTTAQGLYLNLDGKSERSFMELIKWLSGKNIYKAQKQKPYSTIPVQPISWDDISLSQNIIIPLGHASFYIQLQACKILTDPVFFNVGFAKRHTSLPSHPEYFSDIDIILLSHNHRDHIDKKSIQLLSRQNPQALILTGLGIAKMLKKWGIKNHIQEAGWYQQYNIGHGLDITYLPAKHWSSRWGNDRNNKLWGSFMIQAPKDNKHIYFGADSGYGIHFKEIGNLFTTIDIALIGIGAYEPEWFMHTSHTGPEAAIRAIRDLKAKRLLPMHYGTFDLSNEPLLHPEQELRRISPQHLDIEVEYPRIGLPVFI